jgi:hypothetical protein
MSKISLFLTYIPNKIGDHWWLINNRRLCSQFWRWEPKIKVSAGLLSGECSFCHGLLTWQKAEVPPALSWGTNRKERTEPSGLNAPQRPLLSTPQNEYSFNTFGGQDSQAIAHSTCIDPHWSEMLCSWNIIFLWKPKPICSLGFGFIVLHSFSVALFGLLWLSDIFQHLVKKSHVISILFANFLGHHQLILPN